MFKNIRMVRNRDGVAIIWVVILLALIIIIASSVMYIARQNTLETIRQEQRMQAYYLSLAGIEIGYAALMTPDTTPGPQYIDRFNNVSKVAVSYSEDIKEGTKTIGKVDVTISNITVSGKRWIEVKSIGTLEDSNVSTSSSLRIDASNHEIIIREEFGN